MFKKEYAFELQKDLNSFVRKYGVTVLNISCYFDGSTENHVAIVYYKE